VIFTLKNAPSKNYLENFKPFQLDTVVVSANGFEHGFSESFLAMIDTGAKHTCISSERMKDILPKIRDSHGKALQPFGSITSIGVHGKAQEAPLYILPNLYVAQMHFVDVVVAVPESKNFDCLIGRSILHQCIATYDPEADNMRFDFKGSLKQSKQKIKGTATFGDVHLFAEFSGLPDILNN